MRRLLQWGWIISGKGYPLLDRRRVLHGVASISSRSRDLIIAIKNGATNHEMSDGFLKLTESVSVVSTLANSLKGAPDYFDNIIDHLDTLNRHTESAYIEILRQKRAPHGNNEIILIAAEINTHVYLLSALAVEIGKLELLDKETG